MKKILLIEKNDEIRENLAQVLELVNCKVFTAGNGCNAAELAIREMPDMIICGSYLPLKEGYGLLQEIQSNPLTQKSQVVFFTPSSFNGNVHHNGNSHDIESGHNGHSNGHNGVLHDIGEIKKLISISEPILSHQSEVEQPIIQVVNEANVLDRLIKDRDINYYKKKQVIFSEGNSARNLYFIKKGKVKTYQTNDYGKQLVVDLHAENDFIGYTHLLENSNYTETAEALEETELVVIPRKEFDDLLKKNHHVMMLFIRLLSKCVLEKKHQMIGLAYNSLRKKVAEALIIICRKYNIEKANNFIIDITRDNLASIAGTATESLIRTLTDFRSEKLIDIENNCIKILDEKKLEFLSN